MDHKPSDTVGDSAGCLLGLGPLTLPTPGFFRAHVEGGPGAKHDKTAIPSQAVHALEAGSICCQLQGVCVCAGPGPPYFR